MNSNKSKPGIRLPHKKNHIAVKVAEGIKLAEEPVGAIDFSNHHCIYRESLRIASALTNKSPNPIMRINPDTSIAYVNSALEELTGYSADELIGLKIPYPWWIKSNLKKTRRNFEKALEKGDNKVEQLFAKKNGELFWVEITTAIVENNGQLQYYLSNWVDITERKRAEKKLKETADYLQNLLDYANVPIIVWNPEFKITRFNHAFEKLTQKSAGEVLGKSLELLFPKESCEASMAHIRRAKSGKRWETVEIPIRRVDDNSRTVLWNSANIYDIDGTSLKATIAQGVDITERKQAEEALRDTTYKLKERVKELDCLYKVSLLKDTPDKTLNEFLQDVVSLIPPAGQYPDLTCARIIFGGNEYKTGNFEKSPYKLSADITIAGKSTGMVEVYHNEHKSEIDKYTFPEEEITLVNTIAREIGKYITRVRAEESLQNTYERLVTEQVAIRGKNAALKEVLNQIEHEKKRTTSFIQSNINKIIMPILRKLRDKADLDEKHYILLLQNSLEEIASPFINKLETKYSRLLPREVQICDMIKNGMTTKEIASILEISIETIRSRRKNIRKKLCIANSKITLTAFLHQTGVIQSSQN